MFSMYRRAGCSITPPWLTTFTDGYRSCSHVGAGNPPMSRMTLMPAALIWSRMSSNQAKANRPSDGSKASHERSPIRTSVNPAARIRAMSLRICSGDRSTG